jgi:glutathione synthase
MNFLFLLDPLETILMHKDTSFLLMWEAHRRKHAVFFLPQGGVIRKNGKTFFRVTRVRPQKKAGRPFLIKEQRLLSEDAVDVVFIRNDPPFDEQYLFNTWMLDLLPERIAVLNHPSAIRMVNEKIWATQFTSLVPPTLIARDKEAISDFIDSYREVIVKPINGYGGQSVFKLSRQDTNRNVILETLTQSYTRDIIVQKYISASSRGDKRVLLLDGDPLGAVNRLHADHDHRNNFFSGGQALPASLNRHDHRIINTLRPHLKRLDLFFVGIDIIGRYLIEVNVTSPTCLQEMNTLNKTHLERTVIDRIERRVSCKN